MRIFSLNQLLKSSRLKKKKKLLKSSLISTFLQHYFYRNRQKKYITNGQKYYNYVNYFFLFQFIYCFLL